MEFRMVLVCILASATLAFVLATAASMFGGRTSAMLRSAGVSVIMAAITIFVFQTSALMLISGLKGIGWLVGMSGTGLLAMYLCGGTLFALGILSGPMAPVRKYQGYGKSAPIITGQRKTPSFSGRLNSMGQRLMSSRFKKQPQQDTLKNGIYG